MVIALSILAVLVLVIAGVVVSRNKKLQHALVQAAKDIQANPDVQAFEKKIEQEAISKATSVVEEKVNKVTKKK